MNSSDKNFAGFELDAQRKVLRRGGEIVPLPLKAVELLAVLLENRGEVVTKDELLDAVWKDTFVEESVLSNNIYILRKTLGELGAGKNLIQTVPRRGYRFAAPADESEFVVERLVFKENSNNNFSGAAADFSGTSFGENETGQNLRNGFSAAFGKNTANAIGSIAVLPLVNETNNADLDYLSDGIAESLIDDLSLVPRLRVIARTTAFRYQAAAHNPQQIGAELDVEAVVTGKISLLKNDLIVKIELVSAVDAAQIWGERYRRPLGDIAEMLTEIAREISAALQLKLTKTELKRLPQRSVVNSEAYNFYLKGRYFWNKRTAEWMKKGVEHFQLALDADPHFAPAYCGLADSFISFATVGALPPQVAVPKAKAAALKALEINENLAEAHAALGFIANNYDWDFEASDARFKRAAEINPNYAIAFHWHGFCLLAREHFAESIELMKRAQRLDPLSPIINTVCGLPFYYMRRQTRAIEIYRETMETETAFFGVYPYLGMAYEQNGEYENAVAAFRRALQLSPDNTFALASLAHVYAVSGDEQKAREILAQVIEISSEKYVSPYGLAETYTALGEKEDALARLEKALQERSWWLVFARVNPRFDNLRDEARFQNILKQLNLAE